MSGYFDAETLMDVIPVGKTQAYQIIKELNAELKKKNYRTIRGKIPARYVYERFGLTQEASDGSL